MKHKAKIIMGLALALAVIAVTIDHIRHRVPAPEAVPDAPSAPGYGGRADQATALSALGTEPDLDGLTAEVAGEVTTEGENGNSEGLLSGIS